MCGHELNLDISVCSSQTVWCLRKWWLWDRGLLLSGLTVVFLPGAEEQAKRETAEKEKRLLEKRCKMLQQKLETLETIFQESMAQMREEIKRERKNLLRGQNERIQRLEVSLARVWTVTAEESPGTLAREG